LQNRPLYERHSVTDGIWRRDSRIDQRLRRRAPAHVSLSYRHGHFAYRADGYAPGVRLDRDVGVDWREIAHGHLRFARIAQDWWHRAVAARDRRAKHRGAGPVPGP